MELHYSKWANSAARSNPGADRVFVKSIRTEGPGAPPGPPLPIPNQSAKQSSSIPRVRVSEGSAPLQDSTNRKKHNLFPSHPNWSQGIGWAPSRNLYLFQPLAPLSANLKGMTCDPGWTDRC